MNIQEYSEMKHARDIRKTVLCLRLKEPEAVRFWNLMDKAKERNAYVDKSDIIRELFGLSKPDVLTIQEIEFFRTGEKKRK